MSGLPTKIYAGKQFDIDGGFITGWEEFKNSPEDVPYIREDLVEALIKAIGEYSFNNTDALLEDVQQAISDIRGKE